MTGTLIAYPSIIIDIFTSQPRYMRFAQHVQYLANTCAFLFCLLPVFAEEKISRQLYKISLQQHLQHFILIFIRGQNKNCDNIIFAESSLKENNFSKQILDLELF